MVPPRSPRTHLTTHAVENQPPPLIDHNAFSDDALLSDGLDLAPDVRAHLTGFGAWAGSWEARELGRVANENTPRLKAFDRYGQRLDEVEFHPAYHALMRRGLEAGVSARAWTEANDGQVQHGVLMMLMTSTDCGVTCPMSMTYAAQPVLAKSDWASLEWSPRILSGRYDERFAPAAEKAGATIGMAMTEKQGGSDVRSNTTRALPILGSSDEVELVGHKWFCSAPMSDAFLTLAYEEKGLSCFLVPRWRPDGSRNGIEIQRLKDKMGDRSNASSEIEYHHAWARRVGEPGRGVATIVQMVQHTRYDCTLGAAGIMRRALAEATWHSAHRTAFQKRLTDQPLMRRTLADLALETEAAIAIAYRLGRALDQPDDPVEAAFARLATPVAKYWVTKRCPGVVYECMEAHGGVGYVEETPMPRLFRQSPLNAIWEGSGNVIALDVARAISREPDALAALNQELASVRGAASGLDRLAREIAQLRPADLRESALRGAVEKLALALQAAALVKKAPDYVAEAFVAARIDHPALTYGATAASFDDRAVLERACLTN